jgi:hypothetical protein
MKRLTICAMAATITSLVVTTALLRVRSRLIQQSMTSVGMPSVMGLQIAAGAKKLPIEGVEDMAVVYPIVPAH